MMEINADKSIVSIIDSLLMAIDLEEKAFMELDEEVHVENGNTKDKENKNEEAQSQQQVNHITEPISSTNTHNTNNTNLPSDTSVSTSSTTNPNPNDQQIVHTIANDDALQLPGVILDSPLLATAQSPFPNDQPASSLSLSGSSEELQVLDDVDTEEGEDDSESEGDENEESETKTKAIDITVPEETVQGEVKPSSNVEGTRGEGEQSNSNTGWKSYKKSFLNPEDNGEQYAAYKAKKEKRDMRKSMNYSNNKVHIKYNKSGMVRSLYGEVQKLLDEKAALKMQIGWVYPQQYSHYDMFEDAKDERIGEPPAGVAINQYLLDTRASIIRDIFFLNSLLEITEENKDFRAQISVLEKQVSTMFAEVKVLESAKGILEKNKAKSSESFIH